MQPQLQSEFRVPGRRMLSVAWSPDGSLIAAGSTDVHVLEAATGRSVATLGGHERESAWVAFLPDGKLLVTSDFSHVRLWDVAAGRELARVQAHTAWIYCVAVAPDGRTLASVGLDERVKLWDAATLAPKGELRLKGSTEAVAYSPDGATLALPIGTKVSLRDANTLGNERVLGRHRGTVKGLAFSPDGKHLAAGGDDKLLRIWNV